MADLFDEIFETPNLESPAPFVPKMMPLQLLYYCAMGKHRRCHGFGWVNTDEFKTNSNAGNKLHVRCSCTCHSDALEEL